MKSRDWIQYYRRLKKNTSRENKMWGANTNSRNSSIGIKWNLCSRSKVNWGIKCSPSMKVNSKPFVKKYRTKMSNFPKLCKRLIKKNKISQKKENKGNRRCFSKIKTSCQSWKRRWKRCGKTRILWFRKWSKLLKRKERRARHQSTSYRRSSRAPRLRPVRSKRRFLVYKKIWLLWKM